MFSACIQETGQLMWDEILDPSQFWTSLFSRVTVCPTLAQAYVSYTEYNELWQVLDNKHNGWPAVRSYPWRIRVN
jgi:hypothetical protein